MISSSPAPQFGQRCMSISNTRLSSRAQLMRPGPTWAVSASPLQELQRAHHQVRGAVAPRGLELELHLACIVELHSLLCQRRPGNGAAQLLQPLALVCFDPRGRVLLCCRRCRNTKAAAPCPRAPSRRAASIPSARRA